jgi:hypothetical protein
LSGGLADIRDHFQGSRHGIQFMGIKYGKNIGLWSNVEAQVILYLILNEAAAARNAVSGQRKIIVRTATPDSRTVKAFATDFGIGILFYFLPEAKH